MEKDTRPGFKPRTIFFCKAAVLPSSFLCKAFEIILVDQPVIFSNSISALPSISVSVKEASSGQRLEQYSCASSFK